jgi:hypothetical protein
LVVLNHATYGVGNFDTLRLAAPAKYHVLLPAIGR